MKKHKVFIMGTRGFPSLQGGVERHCEELYPLLQKDGFEITLLARKRFYQPSDRLANWQNIHIKYFWSPKGQYFESFIHSLICSIYIIIHRPSLVHVHNIGPGFFIPFLKLFHINIILSYHSRNYQHRKWNKFARYFLLICEKLSIKYANKIIVVSSTSKEYLETRYGRKVTLIPNGIKKVPEVINTDIVREFRLTAKKYILFVGRISPEKGLEVLIPAFLALETNVKKGNGEKWQLVIVGKSDNDDKYYDFLKSIARNSENIIFTGFLEKAYLHGLYKQAGLFLLPSYNEGCSLSLLEAISHRLPCMVSDIPENRQFEYSGLTLFKSGDISDLLTKLSEFISNSDYKPAISLTYQNVPNWKNIADLTANEYNDVPLF